MQVVGIIAMLIGIPIAVGVQSLVTSCLVFLFHTMQKSGYAAGGI